MTLFIIQEVLTLPCSGSSKTCLILPIIRVFYFWRSKGRYFQLNCNVELLSLFLSLSLSVLVVLARCLVELDATDFFKRAAIGGRCFHRCKKRREGWLCPPVCAISFLHGVSRCVYRSPCRPWSRVTSSWDREATRPRTHQQGWWVKRLNPFPHTESSLLHFRQHSGAIMAAHYYLARPKSPNPKVHRRYVLCAVSDQKSCMWRFAVDVRQRVDMT